MASHPSATPGLVTIKLTSLKAFSSARVISANNGGFWLDSLELAGNIQRELAGVGPAAVPPQKQFLHGRKVVFVPFAQIEWMVAESPV
jgi:hypothetical protein